MVTTHMQANEITAPPDQAVHPANGALAHALRPLDPMVLRPDDRANSASASPAVQRTAADALVDALAQELGAVGTDLAVMVQRIRARFLQIADLEIQRVFEAAFRIPQAGPPAAAVTPVAKAPPSPGQSPGTLAIGAATHTGSPTTAADPLDELYHGTVRLRVITHGNMQPVVSFVEELCQRPEIRLLRLTGDARREGVEIALALREALPLQRLLGAMRTVSEPAAVSAGVVGRERIVTVLLAKQAA